MRDQEPGGPADPAGVRRHESTDEAVLTVGIVLERAKIDVRRRTARPTADAGQNHVGLNGSPRSPERGAVALLDSARLPGVALADRVALEADIALGPDPAEAPTTEEFVARSLAQCDFFVLANQSPSYLVVKRLIDIAGATILLVLTAPITIALAILIKLDSPGPALFRQTRVTKNGRHFEFFKFRTMYADARERFPDYYAYGHGDGDLESVYYKVADDPRNTRVGRWLRRTTLDELPNLVNVLRGDLSLVGPRPDLPELVRRYRPFECSCLLTKAGLTGMAQTRGRSLLTVRERLRLDLHYVAKQTIWMDLKIMLRTVVVVVLGVGAF